MEHPAHLPEQKLQGGSTGKYRRLAAGIATGDSEIDERLIEGAGGNQESTALPDAARPPPQKVHQDELRQVVRVGKVGFAVGHRGHLFDEVYEVIVAREHESVNHDPGLAARLDLFESLGHDERV